MSEKSMFFCLKGDSFSESVIKVASDHVFYFDCEKKKRGEYEVKLTTPVRGRKVYLLVPLAENNQKDSANDLIIKTILMLGALKNGKAANITLVINSMAYLDNDLHRERSPLAIDVIISCFESVGADKIIYLDMHRQYWKMVGQTMKDDIRPRKIYAEDIKARGFKEEELIFFSCPGCDVSRLDSYKKPFPKAKFIKEIADTQSLRRLKNKKAIIIGDVITDYEKLYKLVSFLRRKKFGEIHAYISHPIGINFSKINGIDSFSVSDSLGEVPGLPDEKIRVDLRVVSLFMFVGRVLREIDSNGSINKAE